jgi:hypothetical protein
MYLIFIIVDSFFAALSINVVQHNKLQLPKLRQKFHVNWYLEQF